MNNYTIVPSQSFPGLGKETLTGKQIPLEIPQKHIQRESLIKTWKAETSQLLIADNGLVAEFKKETKTK